MVCPEQAVAQVNTSRAVLLNTHAAILAGVIVLSCPLPVAAADWLYGGPPPAGTLQPGEDHNPGSAATEASGAVVADETIATLESEVSVSPDDAALRLRLAEAYAAQDTPAKALESCLKAAGIAPVDVSIRRSCARYAEWAGDLAESRKQFQALLKLAPDDEQGLLGAARAHGWSGKLEQAADYYKRYMELFPDNPDAWIEYARVRSWQGNITAALNVLDKYRGRFGESFHYREERARYLAWDNRPREALAIITPLVEEEPDDYDRLYTRTVALAADQQTGAALESLEELNRIRPDSTDTTLLNRVVRTPMRSSIGAGGSYYNDSDTIEIRGVQLDAELRLTANTALSAGTAYHSVRADIDSGFATIDGRERTHHQQTWVGGSYRFNPLAAVSGRVGQGNIHNAGDFTPYELALDLRPVDSTELSLRRSRDIHAPSPRAASLAILRDHNELAVKWRPDHKHVVEAIASHDDLSDGNARNQLVLAPRRAVLRTGSLNADLGLYLDWQSFDENLNNGYYDPERYERYAGSLFGYWKLNDDHGLSLIGTAGFHEDDSMDGFEFGTDVALELTSGLYRDWMSVARIDYSDRFQGAGGYDGWKLSLGVTTRF